MSLGCLNADRILLSFGCFESITFLFFIILKDQKASQGIILIQVGFRRGVAHHKSLEDFDNPNPQFSILRDDP